MCAGGGAAGSECTLALTMRASVEPGEPDGFGQEFVNFVVRIDADHPRDVPISNTVSLPTDGDTDPSNNTATVVTSLAAAAPPLPPFFPPNIAMLFPPTAFFGAGAQIDGEPAVGGGGGDRDERTRCGSGAGHDRRGRLGDAGHAGDGGDGDV
ncbi:MAG: hypothetical protein DK306_001007 [Chloroflexi bacterium]|nr:MAG: hypothetical protein DK306_001007 [Chloroflexota bacterium]